MSLVFYKNTSPNNYYCEANRLYQSIVNGIPVVVGNNPTMKYLVEKYNIGISIDSDGSDYVMIVKAIEEIINNYSSFKVNVMQNKSHLNWESQHTSIIMIMEDLLN